MSHDSIHKFGPPHTLFRTTMPHATVQTGGHFLALENSMQFGSTWWALSSSGLSRHLGASATAAISYTLKFHRLYFL